MIVEDGWTCGECGRENPEDARFCGGCACPASVLLGQVINERFRLQEKLGEGGMGEVYLAQDERLGRQVAVKLLASELMANEQARRRMWQEGQTLARIDDVNVVKVFDLLEVPTAGGGETLAMTMELVPGDSLRTRLEGGAVPWREACALVAGVLSGLTAIHRAGLVHRDIKPSNVLIAENGTPKVADLGIARDMSGRMQTRVGLSLGTSAYMSPEQARGEVVDQRTDVYAAGLLLYELVAGQSPYADVPDDELMAAQLGLQISLKPVAAAGAGVITEVLAAALEKDKADRPASAEMFRRRLAEAVSDAPATPAVGATPTKTAARMGKETLLTVAAAGAALTLVFALTSSGPEQAIAPGSASAACEALSPRYVSGSEEPGWIIDPESLCAVWDPAPEGDETIKYSGGCVACIAQGDGTLQWCKEGVCDGDKYAGTFRNGVEDGRGRYVDVDGNTYVGEFRAGERDGRGALTEANGDTYVGEWKSHQRHGAGTQTDASGDTYVGEWKSDQRHGQGAMAYADGRKYLGEWKSDQRHGQGAMTLSDGKYVGEWQDDLMHGQGVMTADNGNKYVGGFRAGKLHGEGTMIHANGRRKTGRWLNGKPQ